MAPKLAGPGGFSRRAPIIYQPACKPGSVGRRFPFARRPFLCDAGCPAPHSNLPGRLVRTDWDFRSPRFRGDKFAGPAPPLFGLAPGGVCRAASVAGDAVRSYRTVSPLPLSAEASTGGLVLCGTFPGVAPAGRYPAPFRPWSPDFPPRRPFGLAGAAVRPTDLLQMGVRHACGQGLTRWLCPFG
jgi:hypothetical protein